jgi:ABC-2 type transport system ATP-binding protein
VARDGDGGLTVTAVAEPATVTATLAERGLYVSELTPVTVDLESVFLGLTQDEAADTTEETTT